MRLNELSDNQGARKVRTRVGRGIGSGKGKTCGKGQKGQKSRRGVAINGFEGGQMPIYRRLPKRGFTNIFKKRYGVVNLGLIQQAIDEGKIKESDVLTIDLLESKGLVRSREDGVRLLAKGAIKGKLTIEVTGASDSAIKAVEALGGSVRLVGNKKKIDSVDKK